MGLLLINKNLSLTVSFEANQIKSNQIYLFIYLLNSVQLHVTFVHRLHYKQIITSKIKNKNNNDLIVSELGSSK